MAGNAIRCSVVASLLSVFSIFCSLTCGKISQLIKAALGFCYFLQVICHIMFLRRLSSLLNNIILFNITLNREYLSFHSLKYICKMS